MDANQFTVALSQVEQDHELVLESIQALKESMDWLGDSENKQPRRILPRLQEHYDFLTSRFAAHVADEEAILFPLLEEQLPAGPELVAQLRREHAEIARKREEWGDCLLIAQELERELPRAVRLDLLAYGYSLWELLDAHTHTESTAVRRCLACPVAG